MCPIFLLFSPHLPTQPKYYRYDFSLVMDYDIYFFTKDRLAMGYPLADFHSPWSNVLNRFPLLGFDFVNFTLELTVSRLLCKPFLTIDDSINLLHIQGCTSLFTFDWLASKSKILSRFGMGGFYRHTRFQAYFLSVYFCSKKKLAQ